MMMRAVSLLLISPVFLWEEAVAILQSSSSFSSLRRSLQKDVKVISTITTTTISSSEIQNNNTTIIHRQLQQQAQAKEISLSYPHPLPWDETLATYREYPDSASQLLQEEVQNIGPPLGLDVTIRLDRYVTTFALFELMKGMVRRLRKQNQIIHLNPHYYVATGLEHQCRRQQRNPDTGALEEMEIQPIPAHCKRDCLNHGRYCLASPRPDHPQVRTGAELLQETLFRICFEEVYHATDVRFFQYMEVYDALQCFNSTTHHVALDTAREPSLLPCSFQALQQIPRTSQRAMEQCLHLAGGMYRDDKNIKLQRQVDRRQDTNHRGGIYNRDELPLVKLAQEQFDGPFSTTHLFQFVCDTYREQTGEMPLCCDFCLPCHDVRKCLWHLECDGRPFHVNAIAKPITGGGNDVQEQEEQPQPSDLGAYMENGQQIASVENTNDQDDTQSPLVIVGQVGSEESSQSSLNNPPLVDQVVGTNNNETEPEPPQSGDGEEEERTTEPPQMVVVSTTEEHFSEDAVETAPAAKDHPDKQQADTITEDVATESHQVIGAPLETPAPTEQPEGNEKEGAAVAEPAPTEPPTTELPTAAPTVNPNANSTSAETSDAVTKKSSHLFRDFIALVLIGSLALLLATYGLNKLRLRRKKALAEQYKQDKAARWKAREMYYENEVPDYETSWKAGQMFDSTYPGSRFSANYYNGSVNKNINTSSSSNNSSSGSSGGHSSSSSGGGSTAVTSNMRSLNSGGTSSSSSKKVTIVDPKDDDFTPGNIRRGYGSAIRGGGSSPINQRSSRSDRLSKRRDGGGSNKELSTPEESSSETIPGGMSAAERLRAVVDLNYSTDWLVGFTADDDDIDEKPKAKPKSNLKPAPPDTRQRRSSAVIPAVATPPGAAFRRSATTSSTESGGEPIRPSSLRGSNTTEELLRRAAAAGASIPRHSYDEERARRRRWSSTPGLLPPDQDEDDNLHDLSIL